MDNTDQTTKTHKRCDEAFQRSAIEHWMLSGKSVRQIATELRVNVQTLHGWKAKFKELPAGHESRHAKLRSGSQDTLFVDSMSGLLTRFQKACGEGCVNVPVAASGGENSLRRVRPG